MDSNPVDKRNAILAENYERLIKNFDDFIID